jgi:phospholipid/cholesterol/gamma-HCH transport system substrate-binding protein
MNGYVHFSNKKENKVMNKNTKNNIKLGAFVTLGLVIFIAGIYLVGVRQHMFSSTFRISGIFADINGLQVGSNVRFSGINVGIIEDIQQITDSTVQVDMQIEEGTRKFIKKNARATINSDGLVGDKIVSITHGSPGEVSVSNNDFLETVMPVSMEDIMQNLKATTANAVNITDNLAFIMDNVSDGNGIVGKLFFDSSFAEVMEHAMVNLKEGAGGFKDNMDAASHSFLLKGYLKKKEKAQTDKDEEAVHLKEDEQAKLQKEEKKETKENKKIQNQLNK